MSKNLTRKGLAFGAVVALGTTLFAGAPAQAASVLFAPTTGTGNTLVAGETFSLTASLSSDLPASNSTQLKFKVTNTTGVAATVKLNGNAIKSTAVYNAALAAETAALAAETAALAAEADAVADDTAASTPATVAALAAATAAAVAASADVVVKTAAVAAAAGPFNDVRLDASVGAGYTSSALTSAAAGSSVFGIGAMVGGVQGSIAGNPTTIQLVSTAATTASYVVTAFLDANNNAIVDNGELSTAQTVNFVKIADSGITVNFKKPVQTSASVSSTMSFGADVNVSQLNVDHFRLGFGLYGVKGISSAFTVYPTGATPATALNAVGQLQSVAYDSVNNVLKLGATATAIATALPVAASTYGSQAYFLTTGTAGTAHTSFVAAGTEALQVVSATDSNSITQLKPTLGDNIAGTAGAYTVRTGTTSVSVGATVKADTSLTNPTQVAVGAGVAVNYSVAAPTRGTLGAVTDTLSVNGVALTATTTYPVTGTVYTDAAGKISIPVVAGSGLAGNFVSIAYSLPNGVATAPGVITGSATLTWANAKLASVQDLNNGEVRSVVKGGTYTASYSLVDSYNALVKTSGTYQLIFTAAGSTNGVTAPTSSTLYVPFVDGLANVSFTDNSTGAGTNAVSLTLQKKIDGLWTTVAVGVNAAQITNALPAADITVKAAAPVAAAISVSAAVTGATLDNSLAVYANVDTRLGNSSTVTPSGFAGGNVITGVVTEANGAAISGASVTVTAPGVQFLANGLYSVGTITVVTNATGTYSVTAYSHTAGKVAFTVTSGAATKSTSITYLAAASDEGDSLAIVAPATAQSGTTITATVKLVDMYGNPVKVTNTVTDPVTIANRTFSFKASTGVGNVSAAVSATDADGNAVITITTQPADAGTITLTAIYDADGAFTDITAAIKATATIVVSDLVKDAAAKANASVATVTVTAATTSQAGRAVDVTVKAVDAAGAAVAGATVALSSVGAGSLASSSVVTNASGIATVKLVAGASDLGSAVVTATANAKSGSATVEFGATDASVDLIGKRVYVTTEFAAGKRVTIYDNGVRRYSAIQTTDAEKVVMWNVKAGSHTIVVKISGASSDSVTFLVK